VTVETIFAGFVGQMRQMQMGVERVFGGRAPSLRGMALHAGRKLDVPYGLMRIGENI